MFVSGWPPVRGRRADCELRFHEESYGWECVCTDNGELAYSRRFVLKAGALQEAEFYRQVLLSQSWEADGDRPNSSTNG